MTTTAYSARTLLYVLLCILLTLSFFLPRLDASRDNVRHNNCILGADAATYAHGLDNGTWGAFRIRKHALAVAVTAAIVLPATTLGLDRPMAVTIALCLVLSLGVAALFLFLREFIPEGSAFVFALLPASSFTAVTIFSVVETYGITFAAMSLALLGFVHLARWARHRPLLAGSCAGVVAALPGLANPPAVAVVIVYLGLAIRQQPGRPRPLLLAGVLAAMAIGLVLAALPSLYFDAETGFAWQANYLEALASFTHFIRPDVLGSFVLSSTIYSLVSPLDYVRCRYEPSDIAGLVQSAPRIACAAAWLGLLALGIIRGLATPDRRAVVLSLLGTALLLLAFYIYFNPAEAALYSSQWILILVAAAALGIGGRRAGAVAALIVIAWSLWINTPVLFHPLSGDPSRCCNEPIPPAPGDQRQSNRPAAGTGGRCSV